MPRKAPHKFIKDHSDEVSEITQNSDGFSLPPPPDEFGTYRAGTRISAKDMSSKQSGTVYSVPGKNLNDKGNRTQFSNVIISPMNTVGLPTVSGTQNSLYTYPDDDVQVIIINISSNYY